MSVDAWEGGDAYWNTTSLDWSDGFPAPADEVVVSSGQVTATQSIGSIAKLSISGPDTLVAFENTTGNKVLGNAGVGTGAELGLDLLEDDGGSTFEIEGSLTNKGLVQLGDSNLSLWMTDTLMVGSIDNFGGTIDLYGCDGMDPHAVATLDVTGGVAGFGAAGVLEGQVLLDSAALVEFKSGQIQTIAAHASLTIDGYYNFVADASDTTSDSALLGLDDCAGSLTLNGGATLSVSGELINTDFIAIDQGGDSGDSSLTVRDKLANAGQIEVGPTDGSLSSNDFITAATLVNTGDIGLYGSGNGEAALNVSGSIINDGTIDISDDTEKLAGEITGSGGVFALSGASTLEFGHFVGRGETVEFDGANSVALIDSANAFHATLTGLQSGDLVEFSHLSEGGLTRNVTVTGADSFTLDLKSGAQSAALNFSGFAYDPNDFQYLTFDGASGLEIKFV